MDESGYRRPRLVALGGGHGLARTLRALGLMDVVRAAVVTVADDGGSSGRLRKDRDVIALGDLRMALLAMAERSGLGKVLAHRFEGGALEGHSLGNLLLLALIEQLDGDVEQAVEQLSHLIGGQGIAWPSTTTPVTLKAIIDGREVAGQVAIATTPGAHERIWLDPSGPEPAVSALASLTQADVVLIGPGSLYTSIIPNLLVPRIASAAVGGNSRIIYLANLTTQQGETSGMDAQAHVDTLLAHLPASARIEVLRHVGPDPEGATPLNGPIEGSRINEVHEADLAEVVATGRRGPAHDHRRLAGALSAILDIPLTSRAEGR